jgi:hypothetical protein
VREVVQEPGPVRGLVLVLVLGQLGQRQVQQQPRGPLMLLSAPKPVLMAPEQVRQRGWQERHCPQVIACVRRYSPGSSAVARWWR